MQPTEGTEIRRLADYLAHMLPHAVREVAAPAIGEAGAPPGNGAAGGHNGDAPSGNGNVADATLASWGLSILAKHDVDASRALQLQLDGFLSAHPDLADKVREVQRGGGRQARQALRERLREALESTDERTRETLWALLIGGERRDRKRRRPSGRLRRLLERTSKDGRVARGTAGAWMTLLIAIPVVVVFFTIWGGPSKDPEPDTLSTAGLKLFAVWCLSFLPGWLYIRFLGQRAGALWNEYVLNLHRLGWDRAEHLPRPPENSEFHQEWLHAKGYQYPQENNIYRQKFNAYYGRSVADSGTSNSNFSVRSETMFPVFLATIVLASCWVAVLWDSATLSHPASVWDILKFAFFGAYAFIVQSLVRRFFQSDLRPSAYAAAILRIIVVLLTMVALHQILNPMTDLATEAAVAFVVGFFPVIGLQALQRAAATTLRALMPQLTPEYPLNQLDGLNIWYESRLVEEGIEDMENLATANLVDVILHTRVPVGRLVDWVDQAQLYLHLDRAERGHREHRLVKASTKPGVNDGSKDPDQPPTAEEGDLRAFDPLVHGSLSPHSRAGTKSRVALRQLGIRTATDLLKAFPPEEIDQRSTLAHAAPKARFQDLMPRGVEVDQIRTLVRVLDEEPALAPIWNWQIRGVRARRDCRRPRSERTRRHAGADA